ncbi:MAG: hypothetical protein EA383_06465 [Spirochaetaceae bacterium]|nr:MAG: hypothetical protein EA383_06465 [Spirochaetaceae bacterium]
MKLRGAARRILLLAFVLVASTRLTAEVFDYGSTAGRWTQNPATGAVVRLGTYRDGDRTVLRRVVFEDETLHSVDLADLYIGNARIRRAIETGDVVLLYVTDGGSRLPNGLYTVPRTELLENGGRSVIDASWLRDHLRADAGRVASHRDFDALPGDRTGSEDRYVVAHRTPEGSQLVVYGADGGARSVEGVDASRLAGDLRVARDERTGRLLVSFRSRGQTEEAGLHVGLLRPGNGSYVYEELARLPGRFFSVFGSTGEGPRGPLGFGSTYRDAGHDLIVLDDGSIALAYQYITQIQSPLTRPSAGLVVYHLPTDSGEATRMTVTEPQTSRFVFSPRLYQAGEQRLSVYWIAEQHPEFISDVFRADVDLATGHTGRPENISANARIVSDPAAAGPGGAFVLYLQHEPRAGTARVIVRQPAVRGLREWLRVPGDGVPAEDLAALLLTVPLAALYGIALMFTRSLPALLLVYALTGALYRFGPELIRHAGTRLIPVLSCLYLAAHGVPPFSFAAVTHGASLFALAAAAALYSGYLVQARTFPPRGSTTKDMMLPIAVAALVFNAVLAYPTVAEMLAGLNSFVY